MTKTNFYLKMITGSLVRRRSRMLTALLAIAIGSTVLSGLVTIYYDVPRQMGKELRSYGANILLVSSGTESFSTDALRRAEKYFPKDSVVGVTPLKYQNVRVNEQPFVAAGTDFSELKNTSPYWFVSGSYPAEQGEALIGQSVAEITGLSAGREFLAHGVDSSGNKFDKRFKVSGILQTGGSEEECIYMSMSDLENLTGSSGLVDVVECSVSAGGEELKAISDEISMNVPEIAARLVKRVTQSEGAVLGKLQALVYIVTIIVLILTMVCVATTMMAVVTERRREIGLKKALGASNREIVWEFLGEGLFLGALGGALGVVLGYFFAEAVSMNVFTRSISFNWFIVPLSVAVSILVTALACVIPVRSAADVDPALVLRGE